MKTHTFPFLFLLPTSGVPGCGQPGREWQGDGGNEGRPGRRLGEGEARRWLAVVWGRRAAKRRVLYIGGQCWACPGQAKPHEGTLSPNQKKRKEKRVVPWTCRRKDEHSKSKVLTKPGGFFLRDTNPLPDKTLPIEVGLKTLRPENGRNSVRWATIGHRTPEKGVDRRDKAS